MMRISLYAATALLLAGCIANSTLGTAAESDQNVSNLSRLSLGMSQSEVLCIMKQPREMKTIQFNQDTYEVWFYVTRPTSLGQTKMVTANYTPVSFKNGQLAAVGNDYYKWLLRQQKQAEALPPSPKKDETYPESEGLEKALQNPGQATSMCTRVKEADALPAAEDEDDRPDFNREDEEMIDQESEQNFDFW